MKPAAFAYYRPKILAEALDLLSTVEGAKVLSGGQRPDSHDEYAPSSP